jgi:predicted nucleic acid-binding Zn ribbon protein
MFCTYCGSPIASEQSVCANCGRSSTGARVASAERARVAEHVHLLAILWFVIGAFWLIPAVIMAVLATFITVPLVTEGVPKIALVLAPGLFVVLCVVFLASAALRFVAGWGLLKLRPWGRTFALVIAFLGLLHPPFDTALAIYTLFVLLPDAAGDEYRQMWQTQVPKAQPMNA